MKKSPELTYNSFTILGDAFASFKAHLLKIVVVCAIIALPVAASRFASVQTFNDTSVLVSIASVYLSLALLWAFVHGEKLGNTSIAKIYINSSGRFFPYLLASIMYFLMLLFSLLGGMVVILAGAGELPFTLSIVGVAIILLPVYFLVRFSMAMVLTVSGEVSAISAFTQSWLLTSKKFLKLMLAWLLLFVIIFVYAGTLYFVTNVFVNTAQNALAQIILNGVLYCTVLPIFFSYNVALLKRLVR